MTKTTDRKAAEESRKDDLLERGFKALEKGDIEKAERIWAKMDEALEHIIGHERIYGGYAISLALDLRDARVEIARLSGQLCLICGAAQPCELANDDPSPCTFDPDPITAAQRFFKEAVALREANERLQATLDLHARPDKVTLDPGYYAEQIQELTALREQVKGLESDNARLIRERNEIDDYSGHLRAQLAVKDEALRGIRTKLKAAVKRATKKWRKLCDLRYEDEGIDFVISEIRALLAAHGKERG